jgi:hypothetical protein
MMLKGKIVRLMLILVCMALIGLNGIAYAEVKIVDNGDPDATSSGTWVKSSGANPYGSESLYAPTTDVTASYTWCYKVSSVPDDIDIDIWWTWWGNRCNNVPWTVYIQGTNVPLATSGGGLNGIDQTDPNAAGQWNDLVTIPAYSTMSNETICLEISHSINSTCANKKTTCADAVRFSNPPAAGGGDCDQVKDELEQLKNDLQAIINSIP